MKQFIFKLPVVLMILCSLPLIAQPVSNTYKPWTYWWWMGSAVNKTEIAKQLDDFRRVGLGGVHIIPIYGVKGYEDKFLPFLGEEWLQMVQFTIEQAGKLNMGVDMTLGSGWPYGGGWIDKKNAAKKLMIKEYGLKQGDHIEIKTDTLVTNNNWLELIAVFASNGRGEEFNLTSQIKDGIILKNVPPSDWKITCFGIANTNQLVKRAAPGDEGLVLDYFDKSSLNKYLDHFDSAFSNPAHSILPRAFYHDSYEVYEANWTSQFLNQFRKLRGYDLSQYLPSLTDSLKPEHPFIIHDIRETLSDLLYHEFTSPWNDWCRSRHSITRNQAHGSPSNILDLYALSDIPETESFGCSNFSIPGLHCDPDFQEDRFGRPSPLIMKFASSPAHLFNKPLVSSETGTWLANHFKVSLGQLKPQIDELFVSGINHIFYHGITYSPQNEAYPGFLFYASTNFGQNSHFWDELPQLNEYVTECQRLLQNSGSDNDILLYFPIDDLWTKYPGEFLLLQDVHNYTNWFSQSAFGKTARLLWDNGYAFDYISDMQVQKLMADSGKAVFPANGTAYSVIVVPSSDYMNKETLAKLDSLALNGVRIIFADKLPEHPSGFMGQRMPVIKEFNNLNNDLLLNNNIKVSGNLIEDLKQFKIPKEDIKIKGLDFVRKRTNSGFLYFIANLSNRFYEDSISLSAKYNYVKIFDPLNRKEGYIKTTGKFFLALPPGRSCFVMTSLLKPDAKSWSCRFSRDTTYLPNNWTVNFISGNNQNLKLEYKIDSLYSWTEWGDENLRSFCGKAKYSSCFTLEKPPKKDNTFMLIFDDIHETAAVTINGIFCGTVWSLPYQIEIPAGVLKRNNTIEITVQNLSANRIKFMDTQGQYWKKFYDINFVDIKYEPFDASKWNYTLSGLEGRIMLISRQTYR
jgi:hypothetical protein